MKKHLLRISLTALVISTEATQACIMASPLNIDDVSFADVVVVGTVENYEIVRDITFRERMLSNPELSDSLRELYSDPNQSLLSDYARFEVLVHETIVGDVSQRFMATWDNSTFAEPALLSNEQFLMAFRRPESPMPPLQGPSATILPAPEPQSLTVLQAPCAPPFLFRNSSETAKSVRETIRLER
ncbi:hypothetical protein L0666_07300 [Octadecabacter sp. CECT 8868]|uniref:hypothetical protein n=1 Tax=Octadecabacter algicola TaxID=2909342 RepID=UPI001F29B8FD|nr:hypothetical protein [Octadecabacter algicola]MCF2904789.1 hypothetical protein [Octadecabacter algicola]